MSILKQNVSVSFGDFTVDCHCDINVRMQGTHVGFSESTDLYLEVLSFGEELGHCVEPGTMITTNNISTESLCRIYDYQNARTSDFA